MPDTKIQMYSGTVIDPLHPELEKIMIDDIAEALSKQCRFAGHTKEFYSVAQHSLHVAEYIERSTKGKEPSAVLWGLLHDASEAYLVDVPSPLKYGLFGDRYRTVESQLMRVIAKRFNLVAEPDVIREIDLRMLVTEVRDLLPNARRTKEGRELWSQWLTGVRPFKERIVPVCSEDAADFFLDKYTELTGEETW